MSKFFINRPNFAWVIAIVIMLGGLLALNSLSVSQYPQIAPTTVRISATYAGADAETVENSVTKVIEQGMTGIDNLDYMTATSTSTGSASISLTLPVQPILMLRRCRCRTSSSLCSRSYQKACKARGLPSANRLTVSSWSLALFRRTVN